MRTSQEGCAIRNIHTGLCMSENNTKGWRLLTAGASTDYTDIQKSAS